MIGSPERPSVRALSWRSSGDPWLCDRAEIVETDEQELLIIERCRYAAAPREAPYGGNWMAARRRRAIPELAQVPTVAVISYLLSGYEAKTREAGCNRYIAKPFSPASYIARCPARS